MIKLRIEKVFLQNIILDKVLKGVNKKATQVVLNLSGFYRLLLDFYLIIIEIKK